MARRPILILAGAGFLAGAVFGIAASQPDERSGEANPNVVILRSEKRVTLDGPNLRLPEILGTFQAQTGHRFTLEKGFDKPKTTYGVCLNSAPLADALDALAFQTDGVWDRNDTGYHLRARTPEERAARPELLSPLVDILRESLKDTAPGASGLTPSQARGLRSIRDSRSQYGQLPTFDGSRAQQWQLTTTGNAQNGTVDVSYSSGVPGEPMQFWNLGWSERTLGWGTQNRAGTGGHR